MMPARNRLARNLGNYGRLSSTSDLEISDRNDTYRQLRGLPDTECVHRL
jgi:hypothetical protein